MNVLAAIIIGSSTSARFAGQRIKGKSVLEWTIEPLLDSNLIEQVVISFYDPALIEPVIGILHTLSLHYTVDTMKNLHERLIKISNRRQARHLIRLGPNRPMLKQEWLEGLVQTHLSTGADYTYSPHCPVGLVTDIVRVDALKRVSYAEVEERYDAYLKKTHENFSAHTWNPASWIGSGLNSAIGPLVCETEEDFVTLKEFWIPRKEKHTSHNPLTRDLLNCFCEYLVIKRDKTENLVSKKTCNLRLNRVELFLRKTHLLSYPPKAWVVTTTRCNLSCPSCQNRYKSKEFDISYNAFKKGINSFSPFLKEIYFDSTGENFMNPDFPDIIAMCKKEEMYTKISTNGMLLTKRLAQHLIESGVDQLQISIDSPDPRTFEYLRRGARFDVVMKHLTEFNKCKEKMKSSLPLLHWHFVAMRSNIERLPDLIDLAADYRVSMVSVCYLLLSSTVELLPQQESLFFHQEIVPPIFEEARRRGKSHGIEVVLPIEFGRTAPLREGLPCDSPWNAVFIESNWQVKPCCLGWNLVMGTLDKERVNFEAIWNSETYQNLRKSISTKRSLPQRCITCLNHQTKPGNNVKDTIMDVPVQDFIP